MTIFALLMLFALLFLVLGVQFMRGEWLNLIAGNNFVSKEEMKTSYQRRLGRLVAAPMFAAACALAFQAASACFGSMAWTIWPPRQTFSWVRVMSRAWCCSSW